MTPTKKILVGCECSGIIREAFNALHGFWALSCDLKPCEDGRIDYHYQGDVFEALKLEKWDLFICHPECTYIAVSGNRWYAGTQLRQEAVEFADSLWMASAHIKTALENPVGVLPTMSKFLRLVRPQYIQPYQFGENASKKTGLWLRRLPPLVPTRFVQPGENGRYANQTASGQNKLPPSEHRQADRARTYPGIAMAMADQWSKVI